MKRIVPFMLLFCILITFFGCNDHKDLDITDSTSDISSSTDNEHQILKGKKIDISTEDAHNPIGINGNWFYYYSSVDNYNDTADETIYKYNLSTGESTIIGTIKNCTTASGTYAFLKPNKFFCTLAVRGGEYGEKNLHVEIDCDSENISVLKETVTFPPLIETMPINSTQYLEYQPENTNDEGGYLYHVRVGNSNGTTTEVFAKERTSRTSGTTVTCVRTFNNVIYSLESTNGQYYVRSYDLTGKELSCEQFDMVTDLLDTSSGEDTIWDLKVINGYYFFTTYKGRSIMLHKTKEGYEKIDDLSIDTLSFVTCHVPADGNKLIMSDYETNLLIVYDTKTAVKTEYVLDGIKNRGAYLTTDGTYIVYNNDYNEILVAEIP